MPDPLRCATHAVVRYGGRELSLGRRADGPIGPRLTDAGFSSGNFRF
jgi:hypothetical protein